MTVMNNSKLHSYAVWFSFTNADPLHGICAMVI